MDRDTTTDDPLLAAAAGRLARTHRADPTRPGRCAHPRCRAEYPCPPARLAAEAAAQATADVDRPPAHARPAVPADGAVPADARPAELAASTAGEQTWP